MRAIIAVHPRGPSADVDSILGRTHGLALIVKAAQAHCTLVRRQAFSGGAYVDYQVDKNCIPPDSNNKIKS